MDAIDAALKPAEPELDPGWHIEHWAYAGFWYSEKSKKLHTVWEANGEESLWAKDSRPYSAHIGSTYAVEVNEARSARIKSAKRLPGIPHIKTDEWRARSLENETLAGRVTFEKNLAKDNTNIGDLTLNEVRHMLASRIGLRNRATLLATVIAYIDRR